MKSLFLHWIIPLYIITITRDSSYLIMLWRIWVWPLAMFRHWRRIRIWNTRVHGVMGSVVYHKPVRNVGVWVWRRLWIPWVHSSNILVIHLRVYRMLHRMMSGVVKLWEIGVMGIWVMRWMHAECWNTSVRWSKWTGKWEQGVRFANKLVHIPFPSDLCYILICKSNKMIQ